MDPKEFQSYNRRKRGHDYYGPFIYHIILKKREGAPDFGKIAGDPSIEPGKPGSAFTSYSKLGFAMHNALKEFEKRYPEFRKYQYSIMPDHVHLILHKLVRTETHLEKYIYILKEITAEKYQAEGFEYLHPDQIFQERFTDKLLYRKIKLDTWMRYVSHNPHRRAMILKFPQFFQRKRNIEINGKCYEAYGNLFLFRNPDKFPIRVRSHFSPDQMSDFKKYALELAEEGTVLVSPFISKSEKEIRREAEELGAKLILIQQEEFRDKFKPSLHDFELCSQGKLMIVSLGLSKKTSLTRAICIRMNELAEAIFRL